MNSRILKASLAGLCLAATAAMADDVPARNASSATAAVSTAAMEADIAAQLAANPLPERIDGAAAAVTSPDGSSLVLADDSTMSISVVRVGPDGAVIVGCVHSREEYKAFFEADPTPTGPEVR